MSQGSSIEWTDATWNPVRGCSRVSEGCRHCYAERQAARFRGDDDPFHGFAYSDKAGPRWTGRVELITEKLGEPLRWHKPRRIFVNSMSDLFHEKLSDEAIAAIFGVMAACQQHTFQVLTKRPKRARLWFDRIDHLQLATSPGTKAWPIYVASFEAARRMGVKYGERGLRDNGSLPWPLPNVWLGVSVENQATADERIPLLLQTPAALRFVSYEPALGPVDFTSVPVRQLGASFWNPLLPPPPDAGGAWAKLGKINWLIVGGESGPGARPFDIGWARSAVAQCKAAGVRVFVKQLGARPGYHKDNGLVLPGPDADALIEEPGGFRWWQLRDRKGGDPSEWPEDLRVREFPKESR